MTLVAGSMLGPYRIVEQVGRGGMATVYKAFHAPLKRFVAIKVLPEFLASDAGFRARFEQEAVAIASLRHPNILTVFDHGEQDGVAYIVTEFVDGGTLADQLGEPLPADYVRSVLSPIASALDYAHARGVLHRDLKPSNILIAQDGTPVLSDFGLALMMTSTHQRLTQTGTVLGTPEYMSPEQCEGEPVTAASDVYSLGVVAYEMLTGRVPFSAATPAAVLLAQIQNRLPPPRQVNPNVSVEAESALLKALAKSPEGRFKSAGDFTDALRAAPLPMTPAARPPRRNAARLVGGFLLRRLVVLLMAVLVLLIAGGGALVLARLVLGPTLGNLPYVTPSPLTTPLARASPSPPKRGALLYQAKLDGKAGDLAWVQKLNDPANSDVAYLPGTIQLVINKPSGNIDAGVNFHPLASYVTELNFSMKKGAGLTFWWQIRTGDPNHCQYQVEMDAVQAFLRLTCFMYTPSTGTSTDSVMTTGIFMPRLSAGDAFDVTAVVNPPVYQIYVNDVLQINARGDSGSPTGQTGFALYGGAGYVSITGIRIYASAP